MHLVAQSLSIVFLGIAAAFILVELGLRVYASRAPAFKSRLRGHDLLAINIMPMGPHGYKQRPCSTFHYQNGVIATSNAQGFRGPEVHVPKPAGTIRIVLLGGSTTHGWCLTDDQTVDAAMRRLFATRYPGRRFEVLNLGFDGYDSYQDYERLRIDGLRFEPDVVILNAGINDVRNARFENLHDPDSRTLLWTATVASLRTLEARGQPTWGMWLKHHSLFACFVALARADAHYRRRALEEHRTISRPNPEALDYFERNVRRTAALTMEHGISLMLSNPPSSIPLRYAPDDISPRRYWIVNAAVTQRVREQFQVIMRKVAAELSREGHSVTYVEHNVDAESFFDDAHLAPTGTEVLASELCDAIASMLHLDQTSVSQ